MTLSPKSQTSAFHPFLPLEQWRLSTQIEHSLNVASDPLRKFTGKLELSSFALEASLVWVARTMSRMHQSTHTARKRTARSRKGLKIPEPRKRAGKRSLQHLSLC